MSNKIPHHRAPWVIIIFLSVAILPIMPYGYYQILRWVVCVSCVYLVSLAHHQKSETWKYIWIVFAGIYNPIIPIHSTKELWVLVNIATITASGLWIKSNPLAR